MNMNINKHLWTFISSFKYYGFSCQLIIFNLYDPCLALDYCGNIDMANDMPCLTTAKVLDHFILAWTYYAKHIPQKTLILFDITSEVPIEISDNCV